MKKVIMCYMCHINSNDTLVILSGLFFVVGLWICGLLGSPDLKKPTFQHFLVISSINHIFICENGIKIYH